MINLTDNICFIETNDNKIIKELKDSLLEVRKLLITYYNLNQIPKNLSKENYKYSYIYYFTENKIKSLNIDTNFINKIINFIEDKKSENLCLSYGFCDSDILLQRPYLRNSLKLVLLSLWKKKIITIPVFLGFGNTGYDDTIFSNFENNLIKHFKEYFLIEENNNKSKEFKNLFLNKVFRIIRASDYSNFSDVSLLEINNLHIYIMDSQSGRINSKIPQGNYYIESFLNEITKKNKSLKYNKEDYRKWLSGFYTRKTRLNYFEYLNNQSELQQYRQDYNLKDTKLRNKLKKEKESNIILNLENEFFEINSKYSWRSNIPIYEEYIYFNNNDSEIWIKVFNDYISKRQINGYETNKKQTSMFTFLMNYIFFYVKKYNEQNKTEIKIPLSPKDFIRSYFINKVSIEKENEKNLLTIPQLLNYKERSNTYKNNILRNIEAFFKFIAENYDEEDKIWNKNLKNPIRESDYYFENRNKKTNKVIIPKNIYSNLKKYLFSIEHFGEYLLEKSLETTEIQNLKHNKIIYTTKFGYVPFFNFNGKNYPIYEIPNIYNIKKRLFETSFINGKSILLEKEIPSNTLIRAFILALNTGLRSSQVIWLDKDKWNRDNDDSLQTYYKLNVNTDKVKESDWSTYISHKVYESLKKETIFQNSMRESFMDIEVNYQNREYTRFEKMIPLFKFDSINGLPMDYNKFHEGWVDLLWCFQNTINKLTDKSISLISIGKPQKVKTLGTDYKYCPLKITAIHTPHSMRATFCTHMAEYLERSEIALLVGHASDLITSEVYIKPETDVLKNKISNAVDVFEQSVNADYFSKDSKAHIKPHLENSSLQKAFIENREQTIELFNITSISLNINKDSKEQSEKAIKLLKEARADHIVFDTTHICPVGGICPQEVMNIIGQKRRCGLCPLALKCIDNLNPIYAKQRDLIREIKNGKDQLDLAIKNKESEIIIHNIEDKVNLDIRELVSWKFSSDILSAHYEELRNDKNIDKKYFVEMPDIVKNHLSKVSISNEKEYLLTRIADGNAYNIFDNPENKYKAEILRRDIIKNIGIIEYDDYYVSDDDKIEVFCAMIKNMMDSNGVNLKNLLEYDCFKYIDNQKKRQEKLIFNKNIKLIK